MKSSNNNHFNNRIIHNTFDNNNNDYLIKLHNLVFNNIYIKRIIFYHLNIYNILFPLSIKFYSLGEWDQFKYKEYLNKVSLWLDYYEELLQLPENIKQVSLPSIPPPEYSNHVIQLLRSVDSITLLHSTFNILKESSFIKTISNSSCGGNSKAKLNQLTLYIYDQEVMQENLIPESITGLRIQSKCKIILSKNVLPSNLKKFITNDVFSGIKSFECGVLPESLTLVHIGESIPSVINQMSSFNTLTRLHFINLKATIDYSIIFPNTLQDLEIKCNLFNAKLPSNLKTLQLFMNIFQNEIQFPSPLEHLTVTFLANQFNKEIFQNNQVVPPNLKSLHFKCSTITDNKGQSILPNKLEKLTLADFNQTLKSNQLPATLTYLDLGSSFNQAIDVNVLPANLKKLILSGFYNHEINPLAIPRNLQLLDCYCDHSINLTPSTHPYTVIVHPDINSFYLPSNTDIRVLRLPDFFKAPLSTLQLQDKSNLEYLHLGTFFNSPIQPSDLPTQNNIKTLELGHSYTQTINLEYFQNLETIIINYKYSIKSPKIITTTNNTNNKSIKYNNYKLQKIIVSPKYTHFIKELDINFYQFLTLKKE